MPAAAAWQDAQKSRRLRSPRGAVRQPPQQSFFAREPVAETSEQFFTASFRSAFEPRETGQDPARKWRNGGAADDLVTWAPDCDATTLSTDIDARSQL